MAEKPSIETMLRLTLLNSDSDMRTGFGYGAAQLLDKVETLGSLNAAAKSMGMAYTKAWKLMRACEEALGFPLMVRDGARGSTLTPEGARMLHAYLKTQSELEEFAASRFAENFAQ